MLYIINKTQVLIEYSSSQMSLYQCDDFLSTGFIKESESWMCFWYAT